MQYALLIYAKPGAAEALDADASGLLTTTVQLGQLMGVAALGSVYLSRAARAHVPGALASAAAMSGTARWLAALSAAGLLVAVVMVRAARSPSKPLCRTVQSSRPRPSACRPAW
jgi:hypothetical protein